jgi:hypothetical protein
VLTTFPFPLGRGERRHRRPAGAARSGRKYLISTTEGGKRVAVAAVEMDGCGTVTVALD